MNKLKSLGIAAILGLTSLVDTNAANTNRCDLDVMIKEEHKENEVKLKYTGAEVTHRSKEYPNRPIFWEDGYIVQALDEKTNVLQSRYVRSQLKQDIREKNPDLKKFSYVSMATFTNNPNIKFVRICDPENKTTNTSRVLPISNLCLDHYKN